VSVTALDQIPAWEPELSADWTVGNRQHWTIADHLGHPALGLTPAALTRTVDEAGMLPKVWSEQFAEALALAAHAFLSFEVGARGGMRGAWSARMRGLAGVVMTQRAGLATPFPAFAEAYAEFRGDSRWGWGDGEGGLRRLYERGLSRGRGFAQVDPHAGKPFKLSHSRDHRALDSAWRLAKTAGGEAESFIPLLPCDVVGCFAPARRLVMLDDGAGHQRPVPVPSVWEIVAVAFALGPSGLLARAERFLALEAQRPARRRRDHKSDEDEPLATTTLEGIRGNFNGSIAAMADIARRLPELRESWSFPGKLGPLDRELRRRGRTTTRTAVPLSAFRRARAEHVELLERSRTTSRDGGSRDGKKETKRYTTVLRRLIWLDLHAQTAARAAEIAPSLLVKHFEAAHRFDLEGEIVIAPAILLTPAKEVPIAPHWRPIHPSTAELLAEWIQWMELGPRDWLFPHEDRLVAWSARQAGTTFTNQNIIPQPGLDHGYQLVRLRHLGEALGYTVGAGWLTANAAYVDRVSAQVFADALLAHVMSQDRLGYKDLEDNRELWAYRVAVGDPRNDVPGVLDYLYGDAGARKGWNVDEVRAALRALDAATARQTEADAALGTAERAATRTALRVDGMFARGRPRPGTVTDTADAHRAWDDQLRHAQHESVSARDRLDDARRRRDEIKHDVEHARSHLAAIKKAGRTFSLPDAEPLQHELDGEETALDHETWEQVLTRAETVRGAALLALAPAGEPVLQRLRHHLNLQELAGLCDVADRTVRNWAAAPDRSPLATDGKASPLIVISQRNRFVAVDRLSEAFLQRLTPSQHELMDQMLLVPMGSTRWSGPSIDNARIEDAEALMQR
jgi:hypothetical protein